MAGIPIPHRLLPYPHSSVGFMYSPNLSLCVARHKPKLSVPCRCAKRAVLFVYRI
jgi:hypothetical protein